MYRPFLLALSFALLAAACASAPKATVSSVKIETILPRPIEEAAFMRIDEYLTGSENKGRRLILRSDPDQRAGYYFTLVLDTSVRRLPNGTTIIGEFYAPQSPDLQTHIYTLPSDRPKTREVFVGLTGADWPDMGAVPAAWRFTITSPNGEPMGRAQSYLWSL